MKIMDVTTISFYIALFKSGMVIISFFFLMLILQRFIARKKKEILYLFISILGLIGSMIIESLFFFDNPGDSPSLTLVETYTIWAKILFSCLFIAAIFSILFIVKVFFLPKGNGLLLFYVYILIGVCAIIYILFFNSVEIIFVYLDDYNIADYRPILMIGILLPVYIFPVFLIGTIKVFKSSRRIEDPLYKQGYRTIGMGQLWIALIFILRFLFPATNAYTYAFKHIMATIFEFLGILYYYLGWIMPDWYKRRINQNLLKKTQKEKLRRQKMIQHKQIIPQKSSEKLDQFTKQI